MTENLLQFIWQFQYFNKSELETTDGEPIRILSPGKHNTNQGPDFSDAKLQIGKTTWAGTVEVHIRTSDWVRHSHQDDHHYRNVILHVVWQDDTGLAGQIPISPDQARGIPIFELRDRVPKILLQRYDGLMNYNSFIACENLVHTVPAITWEGWKGRLIAERLTQRSEHILQYFEQSNYHWEEVFWWMLAAGFGMKVNAEAFEAIARSLPLSVLARQRYQIHQLEALLFGQAGLLNREFQEDYPRMLKKEYEFLRGKYGLKAPQVRIMLLRMRPVNFPTIRLAQLAMLIHHSNQLFSRIREASSSGQVGQWLVTTANDYWHYHYRFDEWSPFLKKTTGEGLVSNVIINTVVPILFTYGSYHREAKYQEKALAWLDETTPESNNITRHYQQLAIRNQSAYDSQALLELKTQYCDCKRCLQCAIGNFLLQAQPVPGQIGPNT